ncbi:MAG: sigma-70 family RNA polymerase sigma factor [Nitrospinae bacterium]|nr:sigma-70 family RNA polymerase sigma factor [Nitrospinota bacterium]MZH41086.1 sigma-70 family RNA polymerase sigma factor [Nitrospinota bacterium]
MNETATMTQAEVTDLTVEEREEWKADIAKSIDMLNEQERLIIALHYHEELTLAEIAQILDIPISKVKKIRDKTLQKFLSR